MSHAVPTIPERAGWRFFWCNWEVACPECQQGILGRAEETEWPVPIDYNNQGIAMADRCSRCRKMAAQDATVIRMHLGIEGAP